MSRQINHILCSIYNNYIMIASKIPILYHGLGTVPPCCFTISTTMKPYIRTHPYFYQFNVKKSDTKYVAPLTQIVILVKPVDNNYIIKIIVTRCQYWYLRGFAVVCSLY